MVAIPCMAWLAPTNANAATASRRSPERTRPRFSRRSRLSSSRSVVVKPSLRRPPSSSACLTHWRIVSTEGSNSRASAVMLRPPCANSTIRRRYSAAYAGCVLGIGFSFFLSPQHRLRERVNSNLVVGGQRGPGGEMVLGRPAAHVGADLGDELQRGLRPDGMDLAQVSAASEYMQRSAEV